MGGDFFQDKSPLAVDTKQYPATVPEVTTLESAYYLRTQEEIDKGLYWTFMNRTGYSKQFVIDSLRNGGYSAFQEILPETGDFTTKAI